MAAANSDEAECGEPRGQGLEALFLELEGPLLAYAGRLTGDRAQAEDLVQEAFVRLHQAVDTVRQPRPWLYRTVHHLAMNHHRSQRKIVPLDPPGGGVSDREPPDAARTPDGELAHQEALAATRASLAGLDERSRRLVRLKFAEGRSYQEMSRLTGISIGQVGYLLHHALKALAADLRKVGLER